MTSNPNRYLCFGEATTMLANLCRHDLGPGGEVRRGGHVMRETDGPVTITLTRPAARLALLPERRLNPWVTLCEFPWLMAGRNDIDWLLPYLPKAGQFSDDGVHWRAGYGPRLRSSPDQVAEVVRRLKDEPGTRRAVVSLWDPEADNTRGSRDYPCTNWLMFHRRGGRGELDLHVVMRSNDLFWGLTGVNLPNWTLLLELVAALVGAPVGRYYHTAHNLHVYERHFDRADRCSDPVRVDPYRGLAKPEPMFGNERWAVDLASFTEGCRAALGWLEEDRHRDAQASPLGQHQVAQAAGLTPDDWLAQWAHMMHLWRWFAGPRGRKLRDPADYARWLRSIARVHWRLAALQYLARRHGEEWRGWDWWPGEFAGSALGTPALGDGWARALVGAGDGP